MWFQISFFFKRFHYRQNVQLRLGDEATKVPPSIFKEIGDKIPDSKIGSDGRYHGHCTELIEALEWTSLLNLTIKVEVEIKESSLDILAKHLIVKKSADSNECTLLIEDSQEENLWTLGYSFLDVYGVSIDTKDAQDKPQLLKFYLRYS